MPKKIRPFGSALAYNANQTVTEEVPRQPTAHVAYLIEVEGEINVTAAVTYRDESPQSIVSRIALNADGDILQSWTGKSLYAWNYLLTGIRGARQVPATGIGVQPFRVFYVLPLKAIGTGAPNLTYCNPQMFSVPRLEITWAPVSDLISAGTATIQNTEARLSLLELLIDPSPFVKPYRVTHVIETFSAANTEARIKLSRDNLYRGLLLRVSDSATGFSLSDTLLNRIRLRTQGTFDRWDATYEVQQAWQRWENVLTEDFETPTAELGRIEGYTFVNLIERGAQDLFDPRALADFDLILDVDANTRIDVFSQMLTP